MKKEGYQWKGRLPVKKAGYQWKGRLPVKRQATSEKGRLPVKRQATSEKGRLPVKRQATSEKGRLPMKKAGYQWKGRLPVKRKATSEKGRLPDSASIRQSTNTINVDKTWEVYSMGLGRKLLGSRSFNPPLLPPQTKPGRERQPTSTGVLITMIISLRFYCKVTTHRWWWAWSWRHTTCHGERPSLELRCDQVQWPWHSAHLNTSTQTHLVHTILYTLLNLSCLV